jgi:4a-hydroxytetrahydrobiopterin dehydratase
MARTGITTPKLDKWLRTHATWRAKRQGIASVFAFPDFKSAVAFTLKIGRLADKHDHHPEIRIKWGSCEVMWWTHDAKGLTTLDLEMAELTDAAFE